MGVLAGAAGALEGPLLAEDRGAEDAADVAPAAGELEQIEGPGVPVRGSGMVFSPRYFIAMLLLWTADFCLGSCCPALRLLGS